MKVLVIPGSLRPNSVGNKLIPSVEAALAKHDNVEVEVATADDIRLPLFDASYVPAGGGGASLLD